MKKILFFSHLFFATLFVFGQTTYTYESIPGDPMGTRIYTLKNGLKVYLSVNKDEPRINTKIAVRAGSKNDPSDCTGLAHYLEHMLFKGNSKIATKNWAKESVLLMQISDLYEKHKMTSDALVKQKIYAQIDSISQVAASFAVPNEYDKMMSSLGASKTNAYTSNEETVYVNEIPSNELEKWLSLESDRFSELTLRLFHTELEAVYEEYNRMMDKDFSRAFLAFQELLFPTHPYGTQTTIGKGEHLKNPSMVKIHDYFNTYYVPNNMAIILVVDLDFDQTIRFIDQTFGKHKAKPVPSFSYIAEQPIAKPMYREIYGPQSEAILLGFRLDGVHSQDAIYLTLIDYMLNNSAAGLIDLNLMQKQKVLDAGCGTSIDNDYSTLYLYGVPKEGQSLDEVKNLILEQIENLKKGNFDPALLGACKKNITLDQEKGIEDNQYRSAKLISAFIFNMPWKEVLEEQKKINAVTLDQLKAFVSKNFSTNYVEVRKLMGTEKTVLKVDKPKITPLSITRDEQSEYAKAFYTRTSTDIQPVYVDYAKEIQKGNLKNNIEVSYIPNKINQLFELSLILDMGTYHDKMLGLALGYLDYLGTENLSSEEFKKELFYNGLELEFSPGSEKTSIRISGLQESFSKGIEMMEAILTKSVPNQEIYEEMVNDILKSRNDAKKEKSAILQGAMKNYALYGDASPFKDIFSEQELKSIKAEQLTQKVKELNTFKHRFFYYGPASLQSVIDELHAKHARSFAPKEYPVKKEYTYRAMDKNEVYFVDYDMLQSEILFIQKSTPFSLDLIPYANIHNQYFGGGLSSIIFQEIRESKALAYSARNTFSVPSDAKEWCFNTTYIGTQVDKLPDAVAAMNGLLSEMPQSSKQFEDAKTSALKQISTDRITKKSIFYNFETAKKMGIDYDYRKDSYLKIKTLTMAELNAFHKTNISSKSTTYLVIGKRDKIDFKALEKLGPVKELNIDAIFGY